MDTGSRPSADRTEVERLLHQLRSTLARLKAELELADGREYLGDASDSVAEAIGIVDALQHVMDAAEGLVIVLDDDLRLAELTARQLLRAGIDARATNDPTLLRDLDPATTQVLIDLTLLRTLDAEQLSLVSKFRPVVMSGAVSAYARMEARGYAATDYLVKPFTIDQMLASLGRGRRLDST